MPVEQQEISTEKAWYIGEDKALAFTIYTPGTTQAQIDADPTLNRQNIQTWTLTWTLRRNRYAADPPILTKTSPTQIAILTQSGATLGQCTVDIDRADTTGLKAGTYAFALARTNAGLWDVVSEGPAVLRKAAAH